MSEPADTPSSVVPTDKQARLATYKDMAMAETGGGGFKLTPQNFMEAMSLANVMAQSGAAVPKHLRDNSGACLRIVMQAALWGFDPFAVATKSYLVNDIIAYEAQLVAAVINTRANLAKRPEIKFDGIGPECVCTVTLTFTNGDVREYESPKFKDIKPKNSPLWVNDPPQQHSYYSLRAAARRWCPEVILGVYDRDEIEGAEPMRDITPVGSVAERVKPDLLAKIGRGGDGFSSEHVDREMNGGSHIKLIDSQPAESIPMVTAESLEREVETVRTGVSVPGEVVGAVRADAKGQGDKSRRKSAKKAEEQPAESETDSVEFTGILDELHNAGSSFPDADELEALSRAMSGTLSEADARTLWHEEFQSKFADKPEKIKAAAMQIVTAQISHANGKISADERSELYSGAINRSMQDNDLFEAGESS